LRSPSSAPLRRFFAVVVLAISAAALSACLPADPPDQIELPAGYEVQSLCDPTAKPGAVALAAILRSRYAGTTTGIVRDCAVGGRSEHKEGRAIDWSGVSAFNSDSRAQVDSTLRWLLDPDAQGHQFAVARRLGVMYIIWDARIWIANEADLGWQPYACSGVTLCHQDHVHLSLTQAGGAKQTSYWTGRTGEPAFQTVAWLDARGERLDVPVTVEPGHRYLLTAHGAFTTSTASLPKRLADANCSPPATTAGEPTASPSLSMGARPGRRRTARTQAVISSPTPTRWSSHRPALTSRSCASSGMATCPTTPTGSPSRSASSADERRPLASGGCGGPGTIYPRPEVDDGQDLLPATKRGMERFAAGSDRCPPGHLTENGSTMLPSRRREAKGPEAGLL